MDTIFALASARGKAGVSVIRISGPSAHALAAGLTSVDLPRRGMQLCHLRALDGSVLDDALVLTFAAPASFTGEDVVELQVHGSTAVVSAVLQDLGQRPESRLAEPGEFTRRALENGKLDLAQVEGLADLIDSETEMQRRQAQRILTGALGALAENWRSKLIRAASLIEAVIDFSDEDIPTDVTPEVSALLQEVQKELQAQTQGVQIAERIRNGFEVAIVGPPNVGKSTLLNALAGRDAAITSEVAGTTRDVIEVRMDLNGLAVTLLDTAGLRDTDDVVEGIGVERARQRAASADLRIFLAEESDNLDIEAMPDDIRVKPKADLRGDDGPSVSGVTGKGLDTLISNVSAVLESRTSGAGIATRERHKDAMNVALGALSAVDAVLKTGPEGYDLVAEELRTAIRALESLVGRIDVENLLDEIFASFCLGK